MDKLQINDWTKDTSQYFYCLLEINYKIIQKIKTGAHMNEILNIVNTYPQLIYFPFSKEDTPYICIQSLNEIKTFEDINVNDNILLVSTLYARGDLVNSLLKIISDNKLHMFNIKTIIVNSFNHNIITNNKRIYDIFIKYAYIVDILKEYNNTLLINAVKYNSLHCFTSMIKNKFMNSSEFDTIIDEINNHDMYHMREFLENHYNVELI